MTSKNPHHEGKEKEFDKNGKKITIPPEDLNIIWGRDNRYWKIQPGQAELLQVCWLEVTGSVRGIDPTKSHRVSFNVSFTPDAFGWGVSPLYVMLKAGKAGKVKWEKVKIDTEKTKITGDSYPVENNSNDNPKLYFGLYEVWTGKWKGGLKIHNVIVEEV
ncbi:unnamed protein product [Fraxinus pennsylvanica]|uniref:Protein PHLOEM PROTEIN 2-LIKE A9-like n=1 Tax=Fraxinus pennsylvanica TaxID=56036 RepID=A0AAD2A644_9LAMI|nr:unnamed protein product [Fraxinus pennsylvanica]